MMLPPQKNQVGPSTRRQATGFSLIELMVAMMIGLITVLATAQALQLSGSRKQTATSGSDATITGAMALYTIERDARNAGFGMTTSANALSCEIRAKYDTSSAQSFALAPAVITQGSNGAPDTIQFMASTKEGVPLPIKVTTDHSVTAANFFVQSDLGIEEGDMMIAVPPNPDANNWCSVFQVTNDTSPGNGGSNGAGQGQNQVIHNSGQSKWNQPGGQTIFPNNGYPTGSTLINLGSFAQHTYSIASNGLQLTMFNAGNGAASSVDLYPQVIQLQAEYGIDANPSDSVTTVGSWTTTTPTTAAGWQGVKAIRIAIVTRSAIWEKLEKDTSGTDIPLTVTSTDANCINPSARNPRAVCWSGGAINALNTDNPNTDDWQHYRYSVHEAVIPLRNVIWQQ